MLNPQTSGIQPQPRHDNQGGRRDPIQHHMPQYQSRSAVPPLYQQPFGTNVRPTHRVLLPQGHQPMYAMPMNAGGIGRGLMQSASRQSNLFSQHQQMMPSHQYPPQFTAPAFVPGQGTQQPILLQQHPGQMMPPPQMAGAAIPTQSLQIQQQPMMRPQHNPMAVYNTEEQQQQEQQQQQQQQQQKADSITSIQPLEVSEPESDAISTSTPAEYLPNAIITKPLMDSIKPNVFLPILEGPFGQIPAETLTPGKLLEVVEIGEQQHPPFGITPSTPSSAGATSYRVNRISYDRGFLLRIKPECTQPPPNLEKKFIYTKSAMMVSMIGAAEGTDGRQSSKDDHMIKDRDDHRRGRENFDCTKLNKLISKRRDKGSGGQGDLRPQAILRPADLKLEGEHPLMHTTSESEMKCLTSFSPSRSHETSWSDSCEEEDVSSATDEFFSAEEEDEVTYVIKAWRPRSQQSDKLSVKGDESRVLYCKFQGILNKLTPRKFSALSDQALQLEINTEERLKECAEIVLNNVAAGPQFAMIYANLCKRMASIKVELTSDREVKNFQQIIHCKCWRNIEEKYEEERVSRIETEIKRAYAKEVHSLLEEQIELILEKRKKLSLGNACLIGELFKVQILSDTFIHECIARLLSSKSDEESLVCFVRLITITGKELDKGKAKGPIVQWFQLIKAIIHNKKKRVCPRVRFMLQDVLELRENSWVPQVRDQELKTIDQIHAETAIEEAKEKEMVQHCQVSMKGAAAGRDSRWGSTDDHITKDRDHRTGGRENFDRTKLNKLISSNRKDKESGGQGYLGPQAVLRPAAGWKKNGPSSTEQTSEGSKLGGKAVSRSTTNPGPKSRTDTHTGNNRLLQVHYTTTSANRNEVVPESKDDISRSENVGVKEDNVVLKQSEATTDVDDKLSDDRSQASAENGQVECEPEATEVPVNSEDSSDGGSPQEQLELRNETQSSQDSMSGNSSATSSSSQIETTQSLPPPTSDTADPTVDLVSLTTFMSGGKKRYEKDFLIQFKNLPACKEIPPNLKTSAVFTKDGGHIPMPLGGGGGGSYHYGSRQPDKRNRQRADQPKKILVQPMEKIHAEAAIEEAKEKEIIQHHQVSMKGVAGGRDSRRGSKDDHMMKDRDYRRGERENFDRTKLNKFISNTRKDKGNVGQGHLGPQAVLRPGWKKNGPSTQNSEGSKLGGKAMPRSTTNPGPKSRTDTRTGNNRLPSLPGAKWFHMTPESERESMLQTVNEFSSKPSEAGLSAPASHAPSRDAPVQAILLCSDKRPSAPMPISEEAIASVQRKVTSTIDELVLNKDYKAGLTAIAMCDYEAESNDEISFDTNDIITDFDQTSPWWWKGTREIDGSNGFFRANYVELF